MAIKRKRKLTEGEKKLWKMLLKLPRRKSNSEPKIVWKTKIKKPQYYVSEPY